VVAFLESLQIMPKTMPGLQKILRALEHTTWFKEVNPNKVIVVAGTNGKGTTCAALEALLNSAGQKTGFYSSPHLVSTTERIRVNSKQITEEDFVKLFQQCEGLIRKFELSHFEALTLMAGHYFFSEEWGLNLDFVILEVGLGGTFDATNAFPHKYSVITKLGLDHVQILGNSLAEVAKNKFGIVTKKGIVIHHQLAPELIPIKNEIQKQTNSNWIESDKAQLQVKSSTEGPRYFLEYMGLNFEINLAGERAAENIMNAITLFHAMGFVLEGHEKVLNRICWQGRMQKLDLHGWNCPVYLSGDHNLQGVESLIRILKDFSWNRLFLIAGIGADKDAELMFKKLLELKNLKLYLTETPFKGRKIQDYPPEALSMATASSENPFEMMEVVKAEAKPGDLCVVTGSLYLVGEILKKFTSK
jgi:dihydrofolate synthase/folylpolyglutamate synthase